MNTKKTVSWAGHEEDLVNALFVADYREYGSFSDFVRYCVKIAVNKDVRRMKDEIHERFRVIPVEPDVRLVKVVE